MEKRKLRLPHSKEASGFTHLSTSHPQMSNVQRATHNLQRPRRGLVLPPVPALFLHDGVVRHQPDSIDLDEAF